MVVSLLPSQSRTKILGFNHELSLILQAFKNMFWWKFWVLGGLFIVFSKQDASPNSFLSGVPSVSNCAGKKRTQSVLKRLCEQYLVVSRLLVSWERSNGAGEGEKGDRFPFLCACNKQQNTKVTPVSLVSALLSVKKDTVQMENGNCIINLDTQLYQHNNTALLFYFLTIYITCSEICFEYKSSLVIVLL